MLPLSIMVALRMTGEEAHQGGQGRQTMKARACLPDIPGFWIWRPSGSSRGDPAVRDRETAA